MDGSDRNGSHLAASDPAEARQRFAFRWLAPEGVWAVYVAVLAALTVTESLVRPESGIDRMLDVAILAFAFLGGGAAWFLSAWLPLKHAALQVQRSTVRRIALSWLIGPMLGFAVCLWLNSQLKGDIDGGLLLFYLPILAIVVLVVVLPLVLHRLRSN